jgi:GT2 family glycosyltransferase
VSSIDVVVVSCGSRDRLRACVAPLAQLDDVRVFVVDNGSSAGSVESIADLRVTTIMLRADRGFAHACNVGWRAGSAPYVLFLDADARIEEEALRGLVAVAQDPAAGLAAPWIVGQAASDRISGACRLVRRRDLEALGGVEDGFSLYRADAGRGRHARSVLAAVGAAAIWA